MSSFLGIFLEFTTISLNFKAIEATAYWEYEGEDDEQCVEKENTIRTFDFTINNRTMVTTKY